MDQKNLKTGFAPCMRERTAGIIDNLGTLIGVLMFAIMGGMALIGIIVGSELMELFREKNTDD